jgi:signal recognition particle subunit SEC65
MAIGGYFVTDEQEKAKRYDMRQKGRELQKHLATLKSELRDYSQAWSSLGGAFNDADYNKFSWEEQSGCIRVARPDPKQPVLPGRKQPMNEIACVGMRYFYGDGLEKLLADLEKTKAELKTVRDQCEAMGDPL